MSLKLNKKNNILRKYLKKKKLDGILISKTSNFSWITGGGDIRLKTDAIDGIASLLIVGNKKYLITKNNEKDRINDEVLNCHDIEIVHYNWWESQQPSNVLKSFTRGLKVASDMPVKGLVDLPSDFHDLQSSLTVDEVKRYKILGRTAGRIMGDVCRSIKPGYSESKVASMVNTAFAEQGIKTVVNLVAADERVFKYRHPVYTNKKISKYVMISACVEKSGLIVSLTRAVHFGKLPDYMRERQNAVIKVNAVFVLNSKVGMKLSDILGKAIDAYKENGFENEWQMHHQGGPTGYETRTGIAMPTNDSKLLLNQAVAWNPTIQGTKAEDTIIVTKNNPVVISNTPGWPMISVKYQGKTIKGPDILVK